MRKPTVPVIPGTDQRDPPELTQEDFDRFIAEGQEMRAAFERDTRKMRILTYEDLQFRCR